MSELRGIVRSWNIYVWKLQRDNNTGVQQLRGWIVRREQRDANGMRELRERVCGGIVFDGQLYGEQYAELCGVLGGNVLGNYGESDGMRELRGLVWGWVLFDGGMHGHHEPELCFLQCWQFLGLCWRADIVFVVYVELQRGPVSEWDL